MELSKTTKEREGPAQGSYKATYNNQKEKAKFKR